MLLFLIENQLKSSHCISAKESVYMYKLMICRSPYVQFCSCTNCQLEKDSVVVLGEKKGRIKPFQITVVVNKILSYGLMMCSLEPACFEW